MVTHSTFQCVSHWSLVLPLLLRFDFRHVNLSKAVFLLDCEMEIIVSQVVSLDDTNKCLLSSAVDLEHSEQSTKCQVLGKPLNLLEPLSHL